MVKPAQAGWQASCFVYLLAFTFTQYNHFFPDPSSKIIDSQQLDCVYDFVIIGGGSAGCVVANRLSEESKWKVLLLEAGSQETDFSNVPALAERLQGTAFDWKYKTEPPKDGQRYCLAMTNHTCFWPKGKVIGGSSSINTMIYTRGNKNDYDEWERMGNMGWGYNDVLPYFKKSEDNTDPRLLRTPYHSSGGYQTVENIRFTTPLVDAFIEGGKFLGYDYVDYNGRQQAGFRTPQGTTRNGSRCSTSKGFIQPVQERPNLDVSLHSFVTGLGFEDECGTPTARTVHFVKKNIHHLVRARKEVILCAGAIASPQILMLSGIGPKKHLKNIGIKLVKDLGVGYNLQDHLFNYVTYSIDKPVTVKPADVENGDAVFQYVLDRKGPLTSLINVEGIAFLNSKYADRSGSYPDVEFRFSPASFFNSAEKPLGVSTYNFRPDLFNGTRYDHLENENLFEIVSICLRPKSKGRVMLRSKDPYDQPIIDPNYLAKQEDIDVMVEGMKLGLELARTPPFRKLNAAPLPFPFPGCEQFSLYSDEYLECTIRHFTRSSNHPSCTCSMGVTSNAVVDPSLRVYGVNGLRVIDASVMPKLPSAHTNAPVIMIAEKGADMIKEYWRATNRIPSGGPRFAPMSSKNELQIKKEDHPFVAIVKALFS